MDLDWCWYLAVKILDMTEEEFLRSTPKKLFKLAEIHKSMNSPNEEDEKQKPKEVYIDEIIF